MTHKTTKVIFYYFIEIATMRHKSIAIELSWTVRVREIFETCVVAGCTADENDLKDLRQDIQEGEINIHDYRELLYTRKTLMYFEKRSSRAKSLIFHPRKQRNLANFLRGVIQMRNHIVFN